VLKPDEATDRERVRAEPFHPGAPGGGALRTETLTLTEKWCLSAMINAGLAGVRWSVGLGQSSKPCIIARTRPLSDAHTSVMSAQISKKRKVRITATHPPTARPRSRVERVVLGRGPDLASGFFPDRGSRVARRRSTRSVASRASPPPSVAVRARRDRTDDRTRPDRRRVARAASTRARAPVAGGGCVF
jgi:hypothetical protein